MPATDYHWSSTASFANIGRSILSMRRDQQIHSMASPVEGKSDESEVEAFQRHVAERFQELLPEQCDEPLLSIAWMRRLLDICVNCQDECRVILANNRDNLKRTPMDRMVNEFYERCLKALDVCNAIRDGFDRIKQWQGKLEIVLTALESQRSLGEGQFRRAKRALTDLAILMLDEKAAGPSLPQRHRSFGRHANVRRDNRASGHNRSLSWSVSSNWSAARQLNAISNNLAGPRPHEIDATGGLAEATYIMSYVLLFVMWTLVAAFPCQDRGIHTYFYVPRLYYYGVPLMSLHDRILEESRRRDRKNACGLLMEIHEIERCSRHLNELIDSVQFPLAPEKEAEVRVTVQDVRRAYEFVRDGLVPLDQQVREVFRGLARCRTEGYEMLGGANDHR